MYYTSVEQLIGHTPLLELTHIEQHFGLSGKLLAKLECQNPAGSAKDRVALRMIDDAERTGRIRKGSVIIEETSGNTGIGLAAVCAVRGYRLIIVMPDNMSPERIKLMRAYGAEVVLTPGAAGMQGAVDRVTQLAAEIPGSFIAGQFVNPSNPDAHYASTGPEIWNDTEGAVDIFVAGIGTGGTITGTGRYLKERKPEVQIIGFEPETSAFLTRGESGAHEIQGIGAGFLPEVLDRSVIDEIITADNRVGYEYARMLARSEGVLAGISSGAALWAAVEIARRPCNSGRTVVVLLPDGGSRYLSGPLFN